MCWELSCEFATEKKNMQNHVRQKNGFPASLSFPQNSICWWILLNKHRKNNKNTQICQNAAKSQKKKSPKHQTQTFRKNLQTCHADRGPVMSLFAFRCSFKTCNCVATWIEMGSWLIRSYLSMGNPKIPRGDVRTYKISTESTVCQCWCNLKV